MKWTLRCLLTLVLSVPCLAASPDDTDPHSARLKELDLQTREEQLDFQRSMHELELQARRAEIHRRNGGHLAILFLGMIIVRALAAAWVYRDTQQHSVSGLWIAIVLVGGLLALIAYVVSRLGSMQQARTAPA